MTEQIFDRVTYAAMSVAELATAFEQLVGEPPEKRNKLWMLKRMEQAASARAAARRAVERASAANEPAENDVDPPGEPTTEADAEPPTADGAPEVISPEVIAASSDTSDDAAPCQVPPDASVPADVEPGGDAPSTEAAAEATTDETRIASAGELAIEARVTDDSTDVAATSSDEPEAPDDVATGLEVEEDAGTQPLRRRYIPVRFRAMTLDEIHAVFAAKVGRSTKSSDVPYLCWRITRAERLGGGAPLVPRRTRTKGDGTMRGEPKAITLREYPDTIAAVEDVCARHGFRNRLDFFRRAARRYLEELGERDAAAFFDEPVGAESAAVGGDALA